MNFQVDTGDYLGFEFAAFQRKAYALALSKPDQYFEIREKVITSMRDAAVENVYKTLYTALSEGKSADGAQVTGVLVAPKYPQQKVAAIALRGAQTMQRIVEEAVDLILPVDIRPASLPNLPRLVFTKSAPCRRPL